MSRRIFLEHVAYARFQSFVWVFIAVSLPRYERIVRGG